MTRSLMSALAIVIVLAAPARGEDDLDAAEKLAEEAERLYGEGRYSEATPLAERVLAIREEKLGKDHPSRPPQREEGVLWAKTWTGWARGPKRSER